LIQIIIYKLTILLGSSKSLYDVTYEWWWMFVEFKLKVVSIVLLDAIALFFALGYLLNKYGIVNAFGICW
jgi:hypothetical protein